MDCAGVGLDGLLRNREAGTESAAVGADLDEGIEDGADVAVGEATSDFASTRDDRRHNPVARGAPSRQCTLVLRV